MIDTTNGYVIAEAAIQHSGRVNMAKSIARRAKRCGADAVKFQLFLPGEDLFCPLEGDDKRWPRWERSFMSPAQWRAVKTHCDEIGIDFLASAFQHSGVELLKDLDVAAYKVASRAAQTYPYDLADGPFLISTGLVNPTMENIINARFFQCKTQYPHDPYQWSRYDGLSDHSGSPWPAIDALAHGAAIIELHISFYTRKDDPDFSSSITPAQLRMVCDARDAFAKMRSH